MSAVASVDLIRAAFPALQRTHNGHPVAYFDGPGGTQVPQPVVDAMADYLLHHNANTHWVYPSSTETDAMLAAAREDFAAFVNGDAREISFGNNMTTITFHVARALGREWQAGDEVIVTELDHHGNIAPWQALARDRGVVLRWLPLDLDTYRLQMDKLPGLLNPKTRLLAIGAASNILGTVSDVAAAAGLAHDAGALVFVDGVHFAPHFLPDVQALGRELVERLDIPRLEPAPDTSPERLETGTQNHEGIVGAAAAVRWLASLSDGAGSLRGRLATTYAEVHRRDAMLFRTLWDGLHTMPGVTVYGVPPQGARTATLSFSVAGVSSEQVAVALAHDGCFVSNGDFYASTVAKLLGKAVDGVVRIGAACYTTREEIDRVLHGVLRLTTRA